MCQVAVAVTAIEDHLHLFAVCVILANVLAGFLLQQSLDRYLRGYRKAKGVFLPLRNEADYPAGFKGFAVGPRMPQALRDPQQDSVLEHARQRANRRVKWVLVAFLALPVLLAPLMVLHWVLHLAGCLG